MAKKIITKDQFSATFLIKQRVLHKTARSKADFSNLMKPMAEIHYLGPLATIKMRSDKI